MEATIAGMGFVGPSNLVVKAGTTASYSLIFRPQVEGEVEVRKATACMYS